MLRRYPEIESRRRWCVPKKASDHFYSFSRELSAPRGTPRVTIKQKTKIGSGKINSSALRTFPDDFSGCAAVGSCPWEFGTFCAFSKAERSVLRGGACNIAGDCFNYRVKYYIPRPPWEWLLTSFFRPPQLCSLASPRWSALAEAAAAWRDSTAIGDASTACLQPEVDGSRKINKTTACLNWDCTHF